MNKHDLRDAEAIAEAVTRPSMRFVPIKEVEHQDIQALHRVRDRLMGARTALVNEMRGLLAEYGIVLPKRGERVSPSGRGKARCGTGQADADEPGAVPQAL